MDQSERADVQRLARLVVRRVERLRAAGAWPPPLTPGFCFSARLHSRDATGGALAQVVADAGGAAAAEKVWQPYRDRLREIRSQWANGSEAEVQLVVEVARAIGLGRLVARSAEQRALVAELDKLLGWRAEVEQAIQLAARRGAQATVAALRAEETSLAEREHYLRAVVIEPPRTREKRLQNAALELLDDLGFSPKAIAALCTWWPDLTAKRIRQRLDTRFSARALVS